MSDTNPPQALVQLNAELRNITTLRRAAAVLDWDQQTYMPPGGAAARAEQLALLGRLAHARLTDPCMGKLIEDAETIAAGLDPDSDAACLAQVARRDYDQATKLPEDLVVEMVRTASLANQVWIDARKNNDFASFAPWLRKTIDLNRRAAECLGYKEHPFDALVDQAEPGMTLASVRALFDELRPALVDLVERITPQVGSVDASMLYRTYDEAGQEHLGREAAACFGYDFRRGRLDRTTHPFATSFARDDVRITTRYSPTFLPMSLMGTMHEAGHALYEQGIDPDLDGGLLGTGVSAGVHESQSRLWENFVGRSRPFWQYFYPKLRAAFPGVLDDVDQEAFYRAVNKVHPSLIRVEADEVTYCLHIMLRLDLEVALFDGTLSVEDAPAAWHARVREYLGITPPDDTQGILQDVHWSEGFGGFQGYALGNIIAAQLWGSILAAHPTLPEQIAQGQFATLLDWLRLHIHRHGRKFTPALLVERATGSPLHIAPYVRYLQSKFGDIYQL